MGFLLEPKISCRVHMYTPRHVCVQECIHTRSHVYTHAHKATRTQRIKEALGFRKGPGSPELDCQPVPSHPPAPQGTARPSWPPQTTKSPGAQGQAGGWGVSLIVLLVPHPAEETAAGFSLQMTGNAMEGYLGSNYYFEKGGKKAEGETVPTQIICSLGGWEAVSRKRHFEKASINLTSNYLLSCLYKCLPPTP